MPVQEDVTRAQMLRRAIVCGGAIAGGVATWGLPQITAAASKEQDARVLNLVLAVEYTEAAFYQEALERGDSRATSRHTPGSSWSMRRPMSRSSSRRWEPRPSRRRGTSSATGRRTPRPLRPRR